MSFKWSYFRFTQQIRLMSRGKSKNHYDSLGIGSSSTQGEVKSAYYKLSMQYHPDKNQTAESSAKFRDITEAYEVLGNAKTRRLYDKGLYLGRGTGSVDDTTNTFHKSRETRSRPPPPSGRTPVYDYDEWSKNHYGATFQKQMLHKERLRRRKENREQLLSDLKMEKILFFFGVVLVASMFFFKDADYDRSSYSFSIQPPKQSPKD